jgi:hypothetical protein
MTRVRLWPPRRAGRTTRTQSSAFSPCRTIAAPAPGVLAAAAALADPASASSAHAATAPRYTLTIVGGAGTELFGINKNGDVFGVAVEKSARPQGTRPVTIRVSDHDIKVPDLLVSCEIPFLACRQIGQ